MEKLKILGNIKSEDENKLTFGSLLWSTQNSSLTNVIELSRNFALAFQGSSIKKHVKFLTKILNLVFKI